MTMSVKQSGVWYPVTGLYVKQSGSWQPVQTGYVKQSGAWNIFYSSGLYNGSMTAGTYFVGSDISTGYSSGTGGYGSVTPSTFNDGKTFSQLFDTTNIDAGVSFGVFQVSGFSSDPGQTGYFTSITTNSVTLTSASAYSYSYGSGIATWSFGPSYGSLIFGFVDSTTYSVVVV